MRVRSERIVKAVNVLKNAEFQFIKGRIVSAIGFFLFQILEKAFHYRIVIRMTFNRKRLSNNSSRCLRKASDVN